MEATTPCIAALGLLFALMYLSSLVECCETSMSGIVLKDHVYRSVVTRDIFDCYYACVEDDQCQSLNFYGLSGECELNNRTKASRPKHVQREYGALYFSNPFRAPIGSSYSVPAISCLEIYNADRNAASGRYWLLDTSSWKPEPAYCNMITGVVEECPSSSPACLNGATCQYYGAGSYKCVCVPGYTGNHCQTDIDDCSSSPCQNGGVCTDLLNDYVCQCPDLFTEKNCQLAKGVECKRYRNLTDVTRNIRYPDKPPTSQCDYHIQPGWYRFAGGAGTRILDYKVEARKCSTTTPGWMNGKSPSVSEGIVKRKVCFSWGDNFCDYSHDIRVRNCALFYIYELVKTKHCGRYCGMD